MQQSLQNPTSRKNALQTYAPLNYVLLEKALSTGVPGNDTKKSPDHPRPNLRRRDAQGLHPNCSTVGRAAKLLSEL